MEEDSVTVRLDPTSNRWKADPTADPWWIRAAAWVIVPFLGLYLAAHVAVIYRLKKRYPYEWSAIGEPTLFTSMSLPRFQPARDFLATGAYRKLSDKSLERMVRIKRQALRFALLLYAVAVVIRFMIRHG